MPSPDIAEPPDASRPFSQMAKRHWLGWPPLLVGGLALLMFALPMLATIWNMYQRTDVILQESIRQQLLGAARTIAQTVDPELHGTFKTPDQEVSDAYVRQIGRMDNAKLALDTNGMIKFIYTCIEQDGAIRFVLDTTPTGDIDHDGKDDKSHVMEIYAEPSATLGSVLKTGVAAVDHTPYQDRWGTFMSGYAPVFNARHEVVAVAGVDIALTDYDLQRSGVRNVASLSALGAFCLSLVAAYGVSAYHRRLQRSVTQLVTAGEAAMAAARTKSDFLAAMSHELRTPMNAVLGMTELLGDTHLDPRQKSFVNTIHGSGESLLNTLTDILDFSQLDEGRITLEQVETSPRAILMDLQSNFKQDVETKGLSLSVEIDALCPGQILSDPARLRQALRHLITNAIKFTDVGGVVVNVQPEALADGQSGLRFSVRDTGIGISGEQQQRLFQPFFQADGTTTRRHGGTGVGLAICKRLCDAMGGRIWVESAVGKGSTFHFVIPATPVVDQTIAPADREALIWSQDSITQMLASRVIEKQGSRVKVVKTAEEFQSAQRVRPADWLLVDAAMLSPAHTKLLKELKGSARVIALNAEPFSVADNGFDAVLPQPVRPADLRQAMEA